MHSILQLVRCRLEDEDLRLQKVSALSARLRRGISFITLSHDRFYKCSLNPQISLAPPFSGCPSGTYEPTEEECDFPDPVLVDEQTLPFLGAQQQQPPPHDSDAITTIAAESANGSQQSTPVASGILTGVPHFWLNIFKYVPMFELMVKEADEPALKHLADIRVLIKPLPDMSFTLEFCFTANPHFTDTVLTKEYLMKCEPEADMPFAFDGPEIHNSRGCTIHWKEGMDLTKRIVRHKGGPESGDYVYTEICLNTYFNCGIVLIIFLAAGPPKTLKTDTFFNFFDPPVLPDDTNHKDYDSINVRG